MLPDRLLSGAFWSALTLLVFWAARRLHARWPQPWLAPLLVTPLVLGVAIVAANVPYSEYFAGTRWLVWMLGPATVAFAVPIYEQRALVGDYWPELLAAMVVGSVTAVLSSWGLASLVGLDDTLRTSLLPRSISTPFAMAVSDRIGGVPSLTAVFVVATGLLGAVIGDIMISFAATSSPLARGAMFGVGAHSIGTARALQIGQSEGAIAGLVMVLTGLLNMLAAPLWAWLAA
ncbi:MAG: LrgB family protein [Steroidobacteraceae bacterium]